MPWPKLCVALWGSLKSGSLPPSWYADSQMDAQSWRVLGKFQIPSAPGNERLAMQEVGEAVQPLPLQPGQVERIKTAVALASLKDENGRVLIPGFYDRVRPIDDDERQSLGQVPFDDEAFRAEAGIPATWGEAGYTVLEQITARPTLDCNGIFGGYSGLYHIRRNFVNRNPVVM